MEYFAPGFRELQRMAVRTVHGVRLALVRRRLAAAETELGLLGWQQADFDEETERMVDEIQHVEREQARLHNASAELAQKIQALNEERARIREAHEAQRAQLKPEGDQLHAALAEAGTRLASVRKTRAEQERRAEEIGREQRKFEKEHNDLLAIQPQTPQVRGELGSVRDGLLALAEELAALDKQRSRLAIDLGTHEAEYADREQQSAAFDAQMRELASVAGAADAKLANELREVEKEKSRVGVEGEKLESAKLDPYREIGKVLADSGLAPANQPEALSRVRALRDAVEDQSAALAASRAETAQENRTQLRVSLALLAIIALAVALLIGSLF